MVYGFMNDIFNTDYNDQQKVLHNRIRYAFGENGENFWENFFGCEDNHYECKRFIYIFSEMQLSILLDFWKKNVDNIDDDTATEKEKKIKNFLLASQINCFNEYTNEVEENKLACFFYDKKKVIKLIFNHNAEKKGQVNFFNGDFNINSVNDPGNLNFPDDCKKYLRTLLGTLRENINKKFIGKAEIPKKRGWLFYNEKKYSNNKYISYCIEHCKLENKICPFASTSENKEILKERKKNENKKD